MAAETTPGHDAYGRSQGFRLSLDRATWLVGALASGLRLVWVLLFARLPAGFSDPIFYHEFGLSIAAGRGYLTLGGHETAYYPPGYPYFLGFLYRAGDAVGLDGHHELLVGGTQALMWGVSAMAVVVAGRLVFDRRVGLTAGILLACWPNLITYAAAFLSESLFVMLLSVMLAALSWAARAAGTAGDTNASTSTSTRGWWWAVVLASVALAAATMVRPQVLLTVPAVALA